MRSNLLRILAYSKAREFQKGDNERPKAMLGAWLAASVFLHVIFFKFLNSDFMNLENMDNPSSRLSIRRNSAVVDMLLKQNGSMPEMSSIVNSKPKKISSGTTSRSIVPVKQAAASELTTWPVHSVLYHSPRALSRQPELIGGDPSFVEITAGDKISGYVLLRLMIDRLGIVNSVSVLRSSLPHAIEGEVALQFYRATYRPGEMDGSPVNSEMYLFIQMQGL